MGVLASKAMPSPSGRIVIASTKLFDAQAATGVSNVLPVDFAESIIVAVTAPLNSTLTFKFQGSIGKSLTDPSAPDFSLAQAVLNQWDYVSAYDYNDPSSIITGDTGVTIDNATAASNTRMYVINTSLLRWFSMQVSAYTDGSLTAMASLSTV